MKQTRNFLVVAPDGGTREVSPDYEGIKDGLGGKLLTFVRSGDAGCYIDDEGVLTREPLNLAASLFFGQVLYGPAVLVRAEPDDDGDTVPAGVDAVRAMQTLAQMVRSIRADAARKGQAIDHVANPDTLPPAEIHSFDSWDQMQEFLFGGSDGG